MEGALPASFRDPSGFVYQRAGLLYRQVNLSYQADYDALMSSGLYTHLVEKKRLVAHQEIKVEPLVPEGFYKTIQPERVPFMTYPYEWSFSQYRDAAIQTLRIMQAALEYGMILKDASAYNIQFINNRPVLIDTLSFTQYKEGQPWVAYRQFCQHFLAPLALMSKVDMSMGSMMRLHIDGIPLDLASRLLPLSTRANFGLSTHIHLHAAALKRYTSDNTGKDPQRGAFTKNALVGLVDSLMRTVQKLRWKPATDKWGNYYQATNYSDQAFAKKKEIVTTLLQSVEAATILDLGANTGVFSKLAKEAPGCTVISTDYDPAAVEINYLDCKQHKIRHVLPLILDLTNPSPAIGWANLERDAFFQRGPFDVIMALALIHHLAISNNLPLEKIAAFFAQNCQYLLIEFVPKEDSQVQRLLAGRDDIFENYTPAGFRASFDAYFEPVNELVVEGSARTIFWMKKKS